MRILLADDQTNVRFALRTLLERQPGVRVVGEAINSRMLLSQVKARCPDLVLLGWNLPGVAADELLPALRDTCPNLFVIVLSGQPEMRQAALASGADVFISKADPPEELLAAIRSVKQMEIEECTGKS